jgi:hypothetical protein
MKTILLAACLCASVLGEELPPAELPPRPPEETIERPKPVTKKVLPKAEAPRVSEEDRRKAEVLKLGEIERKAKLDYWTNELKAAKKRSNATALVSQINDQITLYKKESGSFLPNLRFEPDSIGVLKTKITIFQVVDDSAFIGQLGDDKLVWFSNISTEGMVDGEGRWSKMAWRYAGTKKYSTALGSTNTIHAIEFYCSTDN